VGSVLACGEGVGGGHICIRMEVWKAGVSHCESTDLESGMLHKNSRVESNVCLWLHFMITAVDFHVEEL